MSSTLLGSPDFTAFIKDKFLSYKKPDKNLPALKELIDKVSLKDIFDEVESVFGKEVALARNVKMFLCQRYTDEKLKDIGAYFGVGESGVSQAWCCLGDGCCLCCLGDVHWFIGSGGRPLVYWFLFELATKLRSASYARQADQATHEASTRQAHADSHR